MKIRLEIELEYNAYVMHLDCEESRASFIRQILSGGLTLYSNEIMDTVGYVTVLRQIEL